jgi:hypothetical protein
MSDWDQGAHRYNGRQDTESQMGKDRGERGADVGHRLYESLLQLLREVGFRGGCGVLAVCQVPFPESCRGDPSIMTSREKKTLSGIYPYITIRRER